MSINYDEASITYDKYRGYDDGRVESIIDFGEINNATRVLDLGCGTGNVASRLSGFLKADIIGLDRSVQMLNRARGKSVEVLAAELDENGLPFRDGSFDAVISTYVIQHINNHGRLFSEIYRILSRGRLIILTSSHKQIENQHPVMKEFFPGFIDADKGRFPDIPVLETLLESAGFRNIRHQETFGEQIPIDRGYLEKVKEKSVSTYHLLPPAEFENGVEKLEEYIDNLSQPEFRQWWGTLIRADKTGD